VPAIEIIIEKEEKLLLYLFSKAKKAPKPYSFSKIILSYATNYV